MPDSHDPLRSLFQRAADAGKARAVVAPVERITERGRRARRRRVAGLAVGACLVLGGGGASVAALLPDGRTPVVPATNPSPQEQPPPSPRLSPTFPPSPHSTDAHPSGSAPPSRGRAGHNPTPTDTETRPPATSARSSSSPPPSHGAGTTMP
ncbi:hypothetical protein [Actinomadura yumaensis]|uniref:Cellulase n=1 Tax=Actinomadura yumaensis TaxID=111807 RepID=A0ABW2CY78_9ACTN